MSTHIQDIYHIFGDSVSLASYLNAKALLTFREVDETSDRIVFGIQ